MRDEFEKQLENALRRQDPSPWFEAKVLEAVGREQPGRPFFSRWLPRWVPAVTALAAVVAGLAWQHERSVRERAAGEAAKAQLELALRITTVKLSQIQKKVDIVHQD
jgi:hypothetical protein